MLNIFFSSSALETWSTIETKSQTNSQPLVLASESNDARKKLLDQAIQNWWLALTEQFSKSIKNSVSQDIDKDTRVWWAIDLATDTLKDLEVASRVNNYSTAVLDKIVLPSISEFNKDNVENLDYSDLKFYTSLFATQNWKGPITVSIDNYINKNFQKNSEWAYSSKVSWEKFSKWVWWNWVFQLIKQFDEKLWELWSFSHSDLQKADIENIRKILIPYINIANSNTFDPQLIEWVEKLDPTVSQNIKDFMTRDQEYGVSLYGQNLEQQIQPSWPNIIWDEQNQKYISNPIQNNPSSNATQPTDQDLNSSQSNWENSQPKNSSDLSTKISQPSQALPDPLNDINHNVVWTQINSILPSQPSEYQQSWDSQSDWKIDWETISNISSSGSSVSESNWQSVQTNPIQTDLQSQTFWDNPSEPNETYKKEEIWFSDWTMIKANINYSDKIDQNYPRVDVSNIDLKPIEENDFSSLENSNIKITPEMKKEFENKIRDNVSVIKSQDNRLDYPNSTTSETTYWDKWEYSQTVNLPNGQNIESSVSYYDSDKNIDLSNISNALANGSVYDNLNLPTDVSKSDINIDIQLQPNQDSNSNQNSWQAQPL